MAAATATDWATALHREGASVAPGSLSLATVPALRSMGGYRIRIMALPTPVAVAGVAPAKA